MEINRTDLITAITFVNHFAGRGDVRFYLNGICLEFRPDVLTVIASDGHRIATMELAVPGNGWTADVIIADYDVKTLLDGLKLTTAETVCFMAGEGFEVLTSFGHQVKRVDARYPDWRRVIPRELGGSTGPVGMDASYLADAMKAYKPVLGKDRHAGVRLEFGPNGVLVITPAREHALRPVLVIMPQRLP